MVEKSEPKKEKSCGGVIIDDGKVLVVWQSNEENEIVGFPKGHVESGETEIDTAKREILEETGINTELDATKRVELFYHIDDQDMDIEKTVVLFAGSPVGGIDTTPQAGEIEEAKWIEIADVEEALVRDVWKDAWRKMREMIEEEL